MTPPPRSQWLARIAGDQRVTATAARLAIAIADLADDDGMLRIRMTALSPHCQISQRWMSSPLDQLVAAGYLEPFSLSHQGRIAVQIRMPEGKAIRETTARLAGVTELDPKFRLDLEIDGEIVSLTVSQIDAKTIARDIKSCLDSR